MKSQLHLRRSLGLALAALVIASAPAAAMPVERAVGLTAQEQQALASRGVGPVEPAVESAALAQERHYSSYGEPAPLTVSQSPPPSDDAPWMPIALAAAVVLAILAASAPQVRRLRIRRRGARVTT
jgi:hypothetical protein